MMRIYGTIHFYFKNVHYDFCTENWIGVRLLVVVCTPPPCSINPSLSSLFSSILLSLLLQSGMTHQYCCGAYRKCRFDRPVERRHISWHAYALLNHSQRTLAAFWWHHPTLCSRLPLFCVKTSSLSLKEKGAGISERTRASSEEEGPLVSEWRERALPGEVEGGWRC